MSTIKHTKGVNDARRGKLFTKLTKEIIVAVKQGGADPDANFSCAWPCSAPRTKTFRVIRSIGRSNGHPAKAQTVRRWSRRPTRATAPAGSESSSRC